MSFPYKRDAMFTKFLNLQYENDHIYKESLLRVKPDL